MRSIQVSQQPVRCLAYSPDGRLLATGDEEHQLRLWTVPAGDEAARFPADHGTVEAVAFHPSSGAVAAGFGSGDLALWRPDSDEVLLRQAPHPGGVRALAWPAGGLLVSAGWDRTVQYHTPTLGVTDSRRLSKYPVTCLALGSSPPRLAYADFHGNVGLFPPSDQALRVTGNAGVFALAAAPGSDLLAAGDAGGAIRLFRLPAGRGRIEPPQPVGTLAGHAWTVYGLGFTPTGRLLVSGSADETVRIWEVANHRLLETFRWHRRWVTCLAVAPDGMTAAAGSADGTVVLFDLADL